MKIAVSLCTFNSACFTSNKKISGWMYERWIYDKKQKCRLGLFMHLKLFVFIYFIAAACFFNKLTKKLNFSLKLPKYLSRIVDDQLYNYHCHTILALLELVNLLMISMLQSIYLFNLISIITTYRSELHRTIVLHQIDSIIDLLYK